MDEPPSFTSPVHTPGLLTGWIYPKSPTGFLTKAVRMSQPDSGDLREPTLLRSTPAAHKRRASWGDFGSQAGIRFRRTISHRPQGKASDRAWSSASNESDFESQQRPQVSNLKTKSPVRESIRDPTSGGSRRAQKKSRREPEFSPVGSAIMIGCQIFPTGADSHQDSRHGKNKTGSPERAVLLKSITTERDLRPRSLDHPPSPIQLRQSGWREGDRVTSVTITARLALPPNSI